MAVGMPADPPTTDAVAQDAGSLPEAFEWTDCEICGSGERRLVARRPDLLLGGDEAYEAYEIHQCRRCGVLYLHPRPKPAKMDDFYPQEYIAFTPAVHAESGLAAFSRRYGLQKRCDLVMRHVARGRLLDVGCATGDFLEMMGRQPGWSAFGVEPSHDALAYARSVVGLDVVEGILNEAPFAPGAYDAITMWDVLEHVYDPRANLENAARLVRPGGILVINHPNVESVSRRLFGKYWHGYELPRHLYLFPAELLRKLMAEYGFQEVERRIVYGTHAAVMTSVLFALEQRLASRRWRAIPKRVLMSKLARVLTFPVFKIGDWLKQGPNVTVVFRKRTDQVSSGPAGPS